MFLKKNLLYWEFTVLVTLFEWKAIISGTSISSNSQSSSMPDLPTSITDGIGTTPSVQSFSHNFQSSSIHELPTSITDSIGTTPYVHPSSHISQSSSTIDFVKDETLSMKLRVPVNVNIGTTEFKNNVTNNLDNLYLQGSGVRRKRRNLQPKSKVFRYFSFK